MSFNIKRHIYTSVISWCTRLRAVESKVGCTPTTTKWQQEAPSLSTTLGLRHLYTEKRRSSRRARVQEKLTESSYPSESGRVKVGDTMMSLPTTTIRQQRAPSWSTTLGLRHVYTEKRRSSRRAQVQEELNMIHYPRAVSCIFTRLRVEESSDFVEAHCGVPSREKPYEIVIYLHVCVFDLWYFTVRVSLRMWQEI